MIATARRTDTGSLTRLIDIIGAVDEAGPDGVVLDRLPRAVHLATQAAFIDERQRAMHLPGQGFSIPLEMLTRDLNLGSPTAGGNLVGSPRGATLPTLGGASLVEALGATIVLLPQGNVPGIPASSAAVTAGWVTGEGQPVGQSEPTFALRSLSMKTVGAYAVFTRKLLKAAGAAADQIVREEMTKAIARALDAAALGGSGAGGQPTGLTGVSGTHSQSGTSLAWAGIQNQLQALGDAGVRDEFIAFVGTPSVRELLAQREKAAGSGLVWDGRSIAGFPAVADAACPAGTLLVGDWRQLVIALQPGVQFIVDPFTFSTSGAVRVVALLDCDVQVLQPAAFSKATSVS